MGKDLDRHFSEVSQMAKKHVKRFSTSLVVRETQIKTTVRYHFTPTRMAIIKKTDIMGVQKRGCGGIGTLRPLLTGMQNHAAALEESHSASKGETQSPSDLTVPLLGIYPREWKTFPHETVSTNVHSSTIHNSPRVEPIQMPINRWMDKQTKVYPYSPLLLSLKNERRGFPGGSAVKNPRANGGDMSLISDPTCCALSPCFRAHGLQLLKPSCLGPGLCNKTIRPNEKPVERN